MNANQFAISMADATDLIAINGTKVTYMVEGETGIGKSSILKELARRYPDYSIAYIDMANMSMGDLMMPVIDREQRCTSFYPNEFFQLHQGKPVIVMLDELPKAAREVKNMVLPLMLERRLGSVKLHDESIVFATGNLITDGLGDTMQAHANNRMTIVEMKKPTAEEWINNFAMKNNVDPIVIAFADQFPQIFQSYVDDKDGTNSAIFNPKKLQRSFVTARSLEKASDQIKNRDRVSQPALIAALSGTIGAAAAADLMVFLNLNLELPRFESIVADPKTAKLPSNPAAQILLVYSLLMRVEKANIVKVTAFVSRLSQELQAMYINKLFSTERTSSWSVQVKEVADMALANGHLFN